ncbi:hypothetical protein AB0C84_06045 [Actinomadura sp. NPDC048955]|uniref:hypothetical protein n=1 Tax=Actinomadura sp. NPDC048955 TaxID=3158228 RepID=UPI0033D937E4
MPVRIWDRLLGREVERPPGGRMPLGRLFFAPGGRSLFLNATALRPGRYLAADGTWTLWDETRHHRDEGDFGHHAMPDDITTYIVTAIGRRLDSLVAGDVTAEEWLSETPLMGGADMDERLRPRDIDEAIERCLPHLRAACHLPVARLRAVNRLVPASQVRRVTPAAITRLTARSEDWAALRPDGIRPGRLLDPARETDLDFYENRVLARLVDHLWDHVQGRLAEVERIEAMLDDVSTYAEDASGRPWRVSQYMFLLIEGLVESSTRRTRAKQLREDLERLRNALVELRGPTILPGVHRHADVGTVLRTTNVFTNDDRYRRAAELWRAWVAAKSGNGPSGTTNDRIQEWCESFTLYTGLLLTHALAQLDLVPEGSFGPGGEVSCGGWYPEPVGLRWEQAGTFVLRCGGEPVLRVVPVAHALVASEQPGRVSQEIEAIASAATTEPRTLIVYPGQRETRQKLPLHVRLRTFQGCEAPAPSGGGRALPLLPVSPLEIDSVTRLARSLRWALAQHLFARYPARIDCPARYANAIAEGTDWIVRSANGLSVVRPPASHELAAVRRRIGTLGHRSAQFMQRGDNAELVDRLQAEVKAAAESLAELARCPLCRNASSDPSRTFQVWDKATFRGSCDVCRASWELRRCGSCDRGYPVLNGNGRDEGAPVETDGDTMDHRFGSEALSAQCWVRGAVAYCPHCGECSEARALKDPRCRRCTGDGHADQVTRT